MRAFKYGFWGCLGVGVALVIGVLACQIIGVFALGATSGLSSSVKTSNTPTTTVDKPIPVGDWARIDKDIDVRVISAIAKTTYNGGSIWGQLQPSVSGNQFYIFTLEGRYLGPVTDSHSFSTSDFHALDEQRRVVAAQSLQVNYQTSFGGTVFGGGSTSGEVVFIAHELTGFYYQQLFSSGNSRVFFEVPVAIRGDDFGGI